MENKLIKKLEDRKSNLIRVQTLAKEKMLFIPYPLSKNQMFILSNFGKMSGQEIANKLKINRSYVYAVIEYSKKLITRNEIIKQQGGLRASSHR